jgi:tRNA(His) guanylyltransferase
MAKDYSGLALRMKTYEAVNRNFLIPNMNNIIRLDGKAFHTYTKGFKRPFDWDLINSMDEAAIYLCSKIQGAKFGYVQSDEISICFTDYDSFDTTAWFDGNIEKIVSVAASMCTGKFNQTRAVQIFQNLAVGTDKKYAIELMQQMKVAEFDARIFQLPNKEEVVNAILWRQQDATRNSISSIAQSMFSDKELFKKNTDQMQEMIFQKSGQNWNDYDAKLKRGRFILKQKYASANNPDAVRSKWVSVEGPILSQDRSFLLNLLPNV